MTKVRYTDRKCIWCGVTFSSNRDDVVFCSGAHKAAYDRAYVAGTGYDGHAELPLKNEHVCEFCGKRFEVNDYARRGGQRPPKFCSSKCRVYFWRAAVGAAPHPDDQPKQNAARRPKGTLQKKKNKGT